MLDSDKRSLLFDFLAEQLKAINVDYFHDAALNEKKGFIFGTQLYSQLSVYQSVNCLVFISYKLKLLFNLIFRGNYGT